MRAYDMDDYYNINEDKQALREQIEEDTKKYLAKGGVIDIETGIDRKTKHVHSCTNNRRRRKSNK